MRRHLRAVSVKRADECTLWCGAAAAAWLAERYGLSAEDATHEAMQTAGTETEILKKSQFSDLLQ